MLHLRERKTVGKTLDKLADSDRFNKKNERRKTEEQRDRALPALNELEQIPVYDLYRKPYIEKLEKARKSLHRQVRRRSDWKGSYAVENREQRESQRKEA